MHPPTTDHLPKRLDALKARNAAAPHLRRHYTACAHARICGQSHGQQFFRNAARGQPAGPPRRQRTVLGAADQQALRHHVWKRYRRSLDGDRPTAAARPIATERESDKTMHSTARIAHLPRLVAQAQRIVAVSVDDAQWFQAQRSACRQRCSELCLRRSRGRGRRRRCSSAGMVVHRHLRLRVERRGRGALRLRWRGGRAHWGRRVLPGRGRRAHVHACGGGGEGGRSVVGSCWWRLPACPCIPTLFHHSPVHDIAAGMSQHATMCHHAAMYRCAIVRHHAQPCNVMQPCAIT